MAAHFCSAQYEYEGGTACDQTNWECRENDTREQVPGEGDYAISVEPVICTATGYPQRYQRLAGELHAIIMYYDNRKTRTWFCNGRNYCIIILCPALSHALLHFPILCPCSEGSLEELSP